MPGSGEFSTHQKPHFFKIYFPELCGTQLRIPPAFLEHVRNDSGRSVSLKGPSGDIWNADLVSDARGMVLQKGWQDFIVDHSIARNDLLLFRYNGNLLFDVKIFNSTACEREDAFYASSCQALTVLGESNARKKAMVQFVENISAVPFCEPLLVVPQSASSDATLEVVTEASRKKSSDSSTSASRAHSKMKGFSVGGYPLIKIEDEEYIAPSGPKNIPYGICKENKNAVKFSNSNNGEVLSKKRWNNPFSQDEPVVIKVRSGTLVSNRRPVTAEEVQKAYEAAKMFKSNHPTALIIMRECYVYRGFYLHIPRHFVKDHLPKYTHNVKLWDPSGRAWDVKYVYHEGYGGLSARWGAFAHTNNLEKDDVCVFELIQNCEMKVHFFRVVEEVTPLVRAPSQLEGIKACLT